MHREAGLRHTGIAMTERPPVNVVTVTAGLCFIALGVLLMLQRAGVVEFRQIIDLWPVALIALGGAIAWQARRGPAVSDSGGAIASLVWLALVGLLFSYTVDRRERIAQEVERGGVNAVSVIAGDRRVDEDGVFRRGYVTTVMGGARLDFSRATVAPGEIATLDVFNVLGGTEIFVPPHWNVVVDATTIAGGIQDERDQSRVAEGAEGASAGATVDFGDEAEPPQLIITGTVILGGVSIK